MDFIKNFPFFSIILSMFSAILCSVLGRKAARYVVRAALTIIVGLSVALLVYCCGQGTSFVYFMGHHPAPWGNEIRGGCLEALFAVFVSVIALLAVIGGAKPIDSDVENKKQNLFYILTCLMTSSLLAMCYTNDLFTAYVFIEINTIAGCGLIMVRQIGKAVATAIRYMVVSLLGSGLFLIGVTLLYTITGHLLMSNIQESVNLLNVTGEYSKQLLVIVGLMTIGLGIKSGMYPFHLWIPEAYGQSNVASSMLLSSIVSKGYIFLLIKIYFRVIGFETIVKSGVLNVAFVLGIIGMIMGSVMAIREKSLRRMIAYSSVAQIGYIYMGIGIGSEAGVAAAIFHMMAHGLAKSLLFLSSSEFTEGSHTKTLDQIRGMGKKYKYSSLCFSIASFSIVGFPMLAGFVSKMMLGSAALELGAGKWAALVALGISTILNVLYFLRVVVILYSDPKTEEAAEHAHDKAWLDAHHDGHVELEDATIDMQAYRGGAMFKIAAFALVALNFVLGIGSAPIIEIIQKGLRIFS